MKRYKLGINNNLRDLGGIINKDGKEIKLLRFIRSDLPIGIDNDGIQFLKKNNFTTVIDLRKEEECTKKENCLKSFFDYYNINLTGDKYPNTEDDIPNGYMDILKDFENINKVINIMAKSKGGVIYNCTAGKDRTGIISMILLLIANAYEDDIIVDYEVSYTYIRDFVRKIHAENINIPAFVGRSNMEIMEKTLKMFYKKYGSIDNYIHMIGINDKKIEKIRDMLIN